MAKRFHCKMIMQNFYRMQKLNRFNSDQRVLYHYFQSSISDPARHQYNIDTSRSNA